MTALALRLAKTTPDDYPQLEAVCEDVRVVHALPGRVRYHLPRWDGSRASDLQAALLQAPGVVAAEVNSVTRNVLVYFEQDECTEAEIRRAVNRLGRGVPHVVDGAATSRRRRSSSQRRGASAASTTSTSRKRLGIVVGAPAANILPHIPKILLLIFSLFTTRTPLGLTLLGLDWLELLTRLYSEPA
jgi:cation transport ATPase